MPGMNARPVPRATLLEMVAYYRSRAAEYDEWWLRQGRYDQGPDLNAVWFAEQRQVFAAFDALAFDGDVLELAPGTGTWTERLLRTASSVTAVDASPEMVALNRARVGDDRVRYVIADLFTWQPPRAYDAVCFGFWISHVPLERLDRFLSMVAQALKPDGTLFFVDGRREPSGTSPDQPLPPTGEQVMTRLLNDGRTFTIVKNFFDPTVLIERCGAAGLDVAISETPTYFMYGVGRHVARGATPE